MSSDTPTSDFEYEEIPNKVIIAKTQEVFQAYHIASEAYKQASEALRNAAQRVEELRKLLPEDMCIQLPSDLLSEFPTKISSDSVSSSPFQQIVLPDLRGVKEKSSRKKLKKRSRKRVRQGRDRKRSRKMSDHGEDEEEEEEEDELIGDIDDMKYDSNDVLVPIGGEKNENQINKGSSNFTIKDRPAQEIENNKGLENQNSIEIRMHKFNSKNTNEVNRNPKKPAEGITLPSIRTIEKIPGGSNSISTAQTALHHHQSLRSKSASMPTLSLEIPYKSPKNSEAQEISQQFRYLEQLNEQDRKNDQSINSNNPTPNQSHLFNKEPRSIRYSNNHGKMVASKSTPTYLISDQLNEQQDNNNKNNNNTPILKPKPRYQPYRNRSTPTINTDSTNKFHKKDPSDSSPPSFPHYPHDIFNSELSPTRPYQQRTPETSTTTSPTTPNTTVSVQQSTIHSFFLDGIPHQSVPASNWFYEVTKHTYTPQPLSAEESELVDDFIKYAGPRLKDPACTQAVIAQEIIDLSNNTCKMAQASVSTMMRRISVPKHPAMRRAIQSWIENERKKSEKAHMYV